MTEAPIDPLNIEKEIKTLKIHRHFAIHLLPPSNIGNDFCAFSKCKCFTSLTQMFRFQSIKKLMNILPMYGAKNDPKCAAVELMPRTEFLISVGNISAVCNVIIA